MAAPNHGAFKLFEEMHMSGCVPIWAEFFIIEKVFGLSQWGQNKLRSMF
jgi:hypothetical protein